MNIIPNLGSFGHFVMWAINVITITASCIFLFALSLMILVGIWRKPQ